MTQEKSLGVAVDRALEELKLLIGSDVTIINLVTTESIPTVVLMLKLAKAIDKKLLIWNCIDSVQRLTQDSSGAIKPVIVDEYKDETDIEFLLRRYYAEFRDEVSSSIFSNSVLYIEDVGNAIKGNDVAQKLIQLLSLKTTPTSIGRRCIIIKTFESFVTPFLSKDIPIVELALPDQNSLRDMLETLMKRKNITASSIQVLNKAAESASGLNVTEARRVFTKSLVRCINSGKNTLDEGDLKEILNEKKGIIKSKKILEYYDTEYTLSDVGGYGRLKDWLASRSYHFNSDPDAKELNLEPPKGAVLLGIPGTGKSLIAKSVANSWKIPLLKLDIGKVYESLVGASESNMRLALSMIEAISPCVLWIDEIEKGVSGMKSSNQSDSGTTSRVIGTLLTWMQENNKPIFIIATANDISQIPPELLRKGRFDEIFYLDLPGADARLEILNICLKRYKVELTDDDKKILVTKLQRFTGSEIDYIIKEGKFTAFNIWKRSKIKSISENKEFNESFKVTRGHIEFSIKNTKILADTMKVDIVKFQNWVKDNAVSASNEKLDFELNPKKDE